MSDDEAREGWRPPRTSRWSLFTRSARSLRKRSSALKRSRSAADRSDTENVTAEVQEEEIDVDQGSDKDTDDAR